MKIQVKISADTVIACNEALRVILGANFQTIEKKMLASILLELGKQFEAKSRAAQLDLFSAKKQVKLSIKYHHAYALQIYLYDYLQINLIQDYEKMLLNNLANQLHQKIS